MDIQTIFVSQFLLSLVAWTVIAIVALRPWLASRPAHVAMMVLLLPHLFRHIGLTFLVPGVVDQPLPEAFSGPAAYGDLAAGLLALLALAALHYRWAGAIALVWSFNLVGTLDLLNALRHVDVAPLFGATWYIPTLLVPLLLVTHGLIFVRLLTDRDTVHDTAQPVEVQSSSSP